MKKIRNSLISSGVHSYNKRLIEKGGITIVWDHWIDASKWDSRTNSRLVYHKLTQSHLHPDSGDKMRNHLADEVLNEDMLHLMRQYQGSLKNGDALKSSVELLEKTSLLVKTFRDPRPVTNENDTRLSDLKSVLIWFQSWRSENRELSAKERDRRLPSTKCMDDIESLLQSFLYVCRSYLRKFRGAEIVPCRFNSDLAENIFCQQRGLFNGNNSNPNYFNYCSTINSIILGQSSKSRARKSNAGLPSADPFSFTTTSTKRPKTIRF